MGISVVFEVGFRHATPRRCGFHSHPFHEVVWHVRGSGRSSDENGAKVKFRAGDVVVHPPGIAHDQRMAGAGEDVCVQLTVEDAPPDLATCIHVKSPKDPVLRAELEWLSSAGPTLSVSSHAAASHRATAVLLELLDLRQASSGRLQAEEYGPAAKARDLIRISYASDSPISQVADAAGVGYDRLRHVFKQRYGMSMKRWQIEVRMARARDLLTHSNLPLKAVASICGFENQRYFSTCFKRMNGCTACAFRTAARDTRGVTPKGQFRA